MKTSKEISEKIQLDYFVNFLKNDLGNYYQITELIGKDEFHLFPMFSIFKAVKAKSLYKIYIGSRLEPFKELYFYNVNLFSKKLVEVTLATPLLSQISFRENKLYLWNATDPYDYLGIDFNLFRKIMNTKIEL